MQPYDLQNATLREHYIRCREGTNNLLFWYATTAPLEDKKIRLPPKLINTLNLPSNIKTMFDYRSMFNGIYHRLYQQCMISLCSDIEFMFKELFSISNIPIPPKKGTVFFQRFNQVIDALKSHGIVFDIFETEVENLSLAFKIRHICVHNFGNMDEKFLAETKLSGVIGETFIIDQELYKRMFHSYATLLKQLDYQMS